MLMDRWKHQFLECPRLTIYQPTSVFILIPNVIYTLALVFIVPFVQVFVNVNFWICILTLCISFQIPVRLAIWVLKGIVWIFCQIGDSRFESREHIRYTRDQLLQVREVCYNFHLLKKFILSSHYDSCCCC